MTRLVTTTSYPTLDITVDEEMFPHLSAEESGQLLYSLQEYARLLAKGDGDLGSVDSVMNTIDTGNYPAPRPDATLMHTLCIKELPGHLVIQEPLGKCIPVGCQKDEKTICVDYYKLNAITTMDVSPLPWIEDSRDLYVLRATVLYHPRLGI